MEKGHNMQIEESYRAMFIRYDEKPFKAVSEQQLGHEILALTPDPANATDFEKAELLAFQFVETYRDKNDDQPAFFKPHRRQPLPDGSERVYPDIKEVTRSMMEYWENRALMSGHPVIKARYAGLVAEFSMQVLGEKASYSLSKIFARALLDTVANNLIDIFLYKAGKLAKALSVALGLNDGTLVDELKQAVLLLEQSVPLTETKSFWTVSFDLLTGTKKKIMTKEEETGLIERLEQRFVNFLGTDEEAAWAAANRLCSFYNGNQDKGNVLRILSEMEKSLTAHTQGQPIFQKIHWLERLYKLFDKYGFRAKAVSILIQVRELSRSADNEMKGISSSQTISQSDIDQVVNRILEFQGDQLFVTLATCFSLDEAAIAAEVEQSAKENAAYYLFAKELLDAKGRKIGAMPPYNEKPELYRTRQAEFQIKYNALLFRPIVDEGIKRGIITSSEIMKFVSLSTIFEKANIVVVERAVCYYISGDYLAFIHVIIPRLEEAARNLVEKAGGNVLVPKDNIHMLKTFDHLLNDTTTISRLGTSTCFHLRSLLTDRVGMNLRNDVAHGMIDPDKFDVQNADALMTAMLIMVLRSVVSEG